MRELANNYFETSEYLSGKFILKFDTGPAQNQLAILAFEILLKSVFLAEHRRPASFSHNYGKGWSQISETAKQEVLAAADRRFAGHVNFAEIDELLRAWQYAFTIGRYSYEALNGETDAETAQLGAQWLEAGADPGGADFAFYPMELHGLIFGLNDWLDRNVTPNSA